MTIDAEGIERLERTLADAKAGRIEGFFLITQRNTEDGLHTETMGKGRTRLSAMVYAIGVFLTAQGNAAAEAEGSMKITEQRQDLTGA